MCCAERHIAIEPKAGKEGYWEYHAQGCDMWRYHNKAEVDELFADDIVVDDVVPHGIEQSGRSTARQIAKNLLRDDSAQRFYVEQVYRLGYDRN